MQLQHIQQCLLRDSLLTCAISLWNLCWNCSLAHTTHSSKLFGLLDPKDSDILDMEGDATGYGMGQN